VCRHNPGIVYQFGPFEVNVASGELLKNGRRIKLQEQPCRLLVALLENPGEVITREELRSRLWPRDTFVDFDGSLRGRFASLGRRWTITLTIPDTLRQFQSEDIGSSFLKYAG
jgi:hypothetical protein